MLKKLAMVLSIVIISGGFLFAEGKETKKILFYRNPMNPAITSPVPMKDSMGMDYVPIYAREEAQQPGIQISLQKQKLLGIEKEVVKNHELIYEIKSAGKVAYDTGLYVTQQEYITAIQSKSNDLAQAARQRLLLAGMSQAEISDLAATGKPQQNLYLPDETAWVYLSIYEQDAGLIKEGQTVSMENPSFPGELFSGKVGGISPVLDPETRSIKVRVKVINKNKKLKPEMFVNATIRVALGKKLAIPASAIIDTGTRKIVFVALGEDRFIQKEVILGQQAGNYVEVISGLHAGQAVVKSGSFFVDSESALRG
jgi:multidrug efflux pump subunit AcrA (membrane-fusion protein)